MAKRIWIEEAAPITNEQLQNIKTRNGSEMTFHKGNPKSFRKAYDLYKKFESINYDIHDKLINEISKDLSQKLDSTIIEGLKRKGFEFATNDILVSFLKTRCQVHYLKNHRTIYLVDNVPFLEINNTPNFEFEKNSITATYGKYTFL